MLNCQFFSFVSQVFFKPFTSFVIQIQNQQQRNEEVGSLTELVRDFLDPKEFYDAVRKHGIDFFCGVPDSLLKDFCAFVTTAVPKQNHVITANEGTGIALASGYHLATGKTAMVYLQVGLSATRLWCRFGV